MWLLRFLFYVISENLSFLREKYFEIVFAALYFDFYELKNLSQIFKILFQAEYINICVLCGVFFSQLKSSFSNEKKNISGEIGGTL